jgi:hypothetical protein
MKERSGRRSAWCTKRADSATVNRVPTPMSTRCWNTCSPICSIASRMSTPTSGHARSVLPPTRTSSTKNFATAATASAGIVASSPIVTTASTSLSTGRVRRQSPRIRAGRRPPRWNDSVGRSATQTFE